MHYTMHHKTVSFSTPKQYLSFSLWVFALFSLVPALAEDVPDAVQAVFTNNCTNACHNPASLNGNLNLVDKTTSFAQLFEVNATCNPAAKRVKERDSTNSVLFSKVNGGTPICGGVMPPGGTISTADQATIRDWIDNLHPNGTINYVPASVRPIVGENGASITLNVNRGPATVGDVTIDFATADGSATAVTDYIANAATLAFADGESAATIVIDILDDADIEGDQNFFVQLSNPLGGVILGAAARSTVTIADDDDPPSPGILLMNGTSMNVDENVGTADIIIRRAQGNEGAVSVTLNSSNGTAMAGVDYEPISQLMVTFANTENIKLIPLTILDNGVFQGTKSFSLQLSAAQGGAIIGSPSTTTVNILDDEPDPNASGGGGGGTEPPPAAPPVEEFRDNPESLGAISWLLILLPFYRRFRRR